LGISGTVRSKGKRIGAEGLSITGRMVAPENSMVSVSGDLSWDGDVVTLGAVDVSALGSHVVAGGVVRGLQDDIAMAVSWMAEALDLVGVDALLGGVGRGGRGGGPVEARGPLDALRSHAAPDGIDGSRGGLVLDGVADLEGDIAWEATLVAEALHIEDAY